MGLITIISGAVLVVGAAYFGRHKIKEIVTGEVRTRGAGGKLPPKKKN